MKSIRKGIEDFLGGIFAAVAMVSLISGVKPVDILKEAGIKIAKMAASAIIPIALIAINANLLEIIVINVIYNTPLTTDLMTTVVLFLTFSSVLGYLSMEGLLTIFDIDNKRN